MQITGTDMNWKKIVLALARNPIGVGAIGVALWGLDLLVGHSIMLGICLVATVGVCTAAVIAWRKRS